MQGKVRQGLQDTGALGEDVLSLVFHQHLHALHVSAPKLQTVLHPLDLKANQDHMGVRLHGSLCGSAKPLIPFGEMLRATELKVEVCDGITVPILITRTF